MEKLAYRDDIIVKHGDQDYEAFSQYADGDIVSQHFTNIEAAEAWIDRHYMYNKNCGEAFQP